MNIRPLGTTGLQLTELGFGGSAIAGLYRAVSTADAWQTMEAAWDLGIRYFDTAPYYGHGLSERRMGDFLRERPRSSFVLSTKIGKLLKAVPQDRVPDYGFIKPLPFAVEFDYSYDGIMRSYEFSLARLGLNSIDILYVDDLEPPTLGLEGYRRNYRIFLESGVRALDELKSSGAIKAYGLGVNDVGACMDMLQRIALDCILLAGRYTLLDRTASTRLIGMCERLKTALVVGGVFNSGITATGPVKGARFNYGEADEAMLARVGAMEKIAEQGNVSLAAAALQFPLRHANVSSVLVGTAKADRLGQNVALLGSNIPETSWGRFDSVAIF